MPTFVLKKYDQPTTEVKESPIEKREDGEGTEIGTEEPKQSQLTVKVTGSISEILANALNTAFANKNIEMSEIEDDDVEESEQKDESPDKVEVKSISTEEINSDPFSAIKRVSAEQLVLIDSKQKPFSSSNEEWFLSNAHDRSRQVFTTATQFADHVAKLMR